MYQIWDGGWSQMSFVILQLVVLWSVKAMPVSTIMTNQLKSFAPYFGRWSHEKFSFHFSNFYYITNPIILEFLFLCIVHLSPFLFVWELCGAFFVVHCKNLFYLITIEWVSAFSTYRNASNFLVTWASKIICNNL